MRPRLSEIDKDLIARAIEGKLEAFDELVELHQGRVFALAYRILGNRDDAADVQQETFVKAWRSLRKFRGEAAFSTWLHRITVNLCLSRKRRNDLTSTVEFNEDILSYSAGPSTAACIERAETAIVARKVLLALPANHRALLVLREIEERPFEEIAAMLGCSVGSARVRCSKARQIMRERFRAYMPEDGI